MTIATPSKPEVAASAAPRRRKRWGQTGIAALYLLPAASIILVFHLLPIAYAFYISLFRWRIAQGPFIGGENYVNTLTSGEFWQALVVTLYFAAGTIPPTLVLAFLIAYALFRKVRQKSFYRMVYFLPYVTSAVAAALIWRWIFHPQYGILNLIMNTLGFSSQEWLLEPRGVFQLLLGGLGVAAPDWAGGPSLALVSIMIYTVWQNLGFAIIILLTGLTSIPPEIYDAARIDGAKEWRILRHITLPLLSPTLFFLSIVSVIGAFQTFNSIYVMTDPHPGGPLGTTRNLTMMIFQTFYEYNRLGQASAIAFVLFFIVLGLTVLQLRVLGRRVFHTR